MYNVAFIPVRAGSKSIKNKNIILVNNKPLVYWTVSVANNSNLDKVFVSTDSIEIKTLVESFGFNKVEVIERSKESSSDKATSESALIEFANKYEFDNVVFLQATSPPTQTYDINGALEKFLNSDRKSLISAIKRHQFLWDTKGTPMNYDPNNRPRRQEWDGYYIENGAFYISSRKEILKTGCRITTPVDFWEMSVQNIFEIDEPTDIDIVEKLFPSK